MCGKSKFLIGIFLLFMIGIAGCGAEENQPVDAIISEQLQQIVPYDEETGTWTEEERETAEEILVSMESQQDNWIETLEDVPEEESKEVVTEKEQSDQKDLEEVLQKSSDEQPQQEATEQEENLPKEKLPKEKLPKENVPQNEQVLPKEGFSIEEPEEIHQWIYKYQDASCTQEEMSFEICALCGAIRNEKAIQNALGHAFNWHVAWPASCEHEGIENQSCSRCGLSHPEQAERTIPSLGHLLEEGQILFSSTCQQEGMEQVACVRSGCNYMENRIVKKQEHCFQLQLVDYYDDEEGIWSIEECMICVYCGLEQEAP